VTVLAVVVTPAISFSTQGGRQKRGVSGLCSGNLIILATRGSKNIPRSIDDCSSACDIKNTALLGYYKLICTIQFIVAIRKSSLYIVFVALLLTKNIVKQCFPAKFQEK
jgi:hypothetical protein